MSGGTCSNENRCDGSAADPPVYITVDFPITVYASQGAVNLTLSVNHLVHPCAPAKAERMHTHKMRAHT